MQWLQNECEVRKQAIPIEERWSIKSPTSHSNINRALANSLPEAMNFVSAFILATLL